MNSIKESPRKYKLYRNGSISFDQYKKYKNILTMFIRFYKTNYHKNKFSNCNGNKINKKIELLLFFLQINLTIILLILQKI